MSGLVFRSDLAGTGRAISILFGTNGVRNKRSYLVGPLFPEFKARFSATAGWHFKRDLTRHLLIDGCGQSHVSAKNYLWEVVRVMYLLKITSGSSSERNNPREQKLGYI